MINSLLVLGKASVETKFHGPGLGDSPVNHTNETMA